VCACIVNWNTPDETIQCVDSLWAGDSVPDTIIVVDNGSNDGSARRIVDWARQRYGVSAVQITACPPQENDVTFSEKTKIVIGSSTRNDGFAAGANFAIYLAFRIARFDFLWFLNSDTVVEPSALIALKRFAAKQTRVGIVGSTIVQHNNSRILECAGGCLYNKWTTVFTPIFSGASLPSVLANRAEQRMDYIYGASMFVRSRVFEKCGTFNPEYFLYYEELDLCNRAAKEGFDLGWCKDSVVRHKKGRSVRATNQDQKLQRVFSNYHENLSTLIYTRRHHPMALPVAMLVRFFGKVVVITWRRHWYLLEPLRQAYRDFLCGCARG